MQPLKDSPADMEEYVLRIAQVNSSPNCKITGELVRIPVPVDSALELAAITDRVAKSVPDGGPAIQFEMIRNSAIPVVTNLLGSRGRLCRCLGVASLDDVSASLDQRLQSDQPGGWLDSLKRIPSWGGLSKWTPKTIKTAACQQVVRLGRDVNLWDLPVPRSWPGEVHPVITAAQILIRNPGTNSVQISQSPLVVLSQTELAWYDEKFGLNYRVSCDLHEKQRRTYPLQSASVATPFSR